MEVDISDKVNGVLKYGFIALVAIAVLCAGGVFYYESAHRTLSVMDAVVACNVVAAKAHAKGVVKEILVSDGDDVEAGTVVARIHVKVSPEEIEKLKKAVDTAKNNLDTVRAGVTVTRPVASGGSVGSEAARARMERMNELYAIGAVSAQERDNAAAEYQASVQPSISYETVTQASSPEAIKSAEFHLRQAEASLRAAEQESAATDIYAPVRGRVYIADVHEGDEVKSGQTILSVGDASGFWIEGYVDMSHIGDVSLGQFVTYKIDGHEYQGNIADIEEPKENGDDDVHADDFIVRIPMQQGGGKDARPGEKATVKISLDK